MLQAGLQSVNHASEEGAAGRNSRLALYDPPIASGKQILGTASV